MAHNAQATTPGSASAILMLDGPPALTAYVIDLAASGGLPVMVTKAGCALCGMTAAGSARSGARHTPCRSAHHWSNGVLQSSVNTPNVNLSQTLAL